MSSFYGYLFCMDLIELPGKYAYLCMFPSYRLNFTSADRMNKFFDLYTGKLLKQKYGLLQIGQANSPDHNISLGKILSEYRPSDTAISRYLSISNCKIVYGSKDTHTKKNRNSL